MPDVPVQLSNENKPKKGKRSHPKQWIALIVAMTALLVAAREFFSETKPIWNFIVEHLARKPDPKPGPGQTPTNTTTWTQDITIVAGRPPEPTSKQIKDWALSLYPNTPSPTRFQLVISGATSVTGNGRKWNRTAGGLANVDPSESMQSSAERAGVTLGDTFEVFSLSGTYKVTIMRQPEFRAVNTGSATLPDGRPHSSYEVPNGAEFLFRVEKLSK